MLVACVYDNEIHWYEAAALLLCYVGYVTIMKYNQQLKARIGKLLGGGKVSASPSDAGIQMSSKTKDPEEGESKDVPTPLTPTRGLRAGSSLYAHHHALAAQNEAVRFRDYRSSTLRAIVHGELPALGQRATPWVC